MDHLERNADPVDACVLARDGDRAGVDIAGKDALAQGLGCGDGKHPGAGADIEGYGAPLPRARRGRRASRRGPAAARSHDAVEREEAAARRAVVAGAESEPCLHLDADAVAAHTLARVRAVYDEAARLHGGEAF